MANKRYWWNWLSAQFAKRLQDAHERLDKAHSAATSEMATQLASQLGLEDEVREYELAKASLKRAETREQKARDVLGGLGKAYAAQAGLPHPSSYGYSRDNYIERIAETVVSKDTLPEYGAIEKIKQDHVEAVNLLDASTASKRHGDVCAQIAEEYDLVMPDTV